MHLEILPWICYNIHVLPWSHIRISTKLVPAGFLEMGMKCGITKNSSHWHLRAWPQIICVCWRMSPFFAIFPSLYYIWTPCPMPPSHAPIKAQHTTPHHILFTKVYSVAFLHLSITTKQTKAPLSQTKPAMAAIVVEARDVADIEGRSLSADAPSSDAPAPSPDSSSSPSDAPSGSSSSDA